MHIDVKYALRLVVFCYVVVIKKLPIDSYNLLNHVLQGCFYGASEVTVNNKGNIPWY